MNHSLTLEEHCIKLDSTQGEQSMNYSLTNGAQYKSRLDTGREMYESQLDSGMACPRQGSHCNFPITVGLNDTPHGSPFLSKQWS